MSVAAGLSPVPTFESFRVSDTAKATLAARNRRQESGLKSFQFAERKLVDLNPENCGQWTTTSAGNVWRLGIRSPAAYSIYLTFASLRLAKGVRLFVYDPARHQQRVYGERNTTAGGLSVAPIAGDSLVIELNVPPHVADYGRLRLAKVYLDVVGAFKETEKGGDATSVAGCDQNINCENGVNWQTEKRSVCKIITDGGLSTGTLLGNTAKDKQPYLLTSYHTIFDNSHAAESIFIFNYEFDCAKTTISELQAVSGATLVSAAQGLDYSLLQLNEVPPASFRPYYSGWDVREIRPERGISIHHPGGRHKQIAIDYHLLSSGTFNPDYPANSSWQVINWEIGSTEPGSSGAPLFNPQHRVVGSLTGGSSSCAFGGSDFFNKLSMSYLANASQGIRLAALLDPLHRGVTFIDGYDPYGFDAGVCDTTSHVKRTERRESVVTASVSGSFRKNTAFAERFTAPGYLLLPGFYLDVAQLAYSSPNASIKVSIWQGDAAPVQEVYSKTLFLKDLKMGDKNYVPLDSLVKLTATFFIGYAWNDQQPGTEFAVYHAANRGKTGPSSMYVYDGAWRNSNASDGLRYSTSLAVSLVECYGRTDELKNDGLVVFPNPCSDHLSFVPPTASAVDEVSCYDVSGRKYKVSVQAAEAATRVSFQLAPGSYVLVVKSAGQQFFSRFIVAGR